MYPPLFRHFTHRGLLMYVTAWLTLSATTASVLANAASLPSVHESQGVSYVTGGIDLDESNAIKAAMPSYPLVVEVYHQTADHKNEYTSSATLTLATPQGAQIFQATLEGPFALVQAKPGHYEVTVALNGQVQHKRIDVKAKGSTRATFVFQGGPN